MCHRSTLLRWGTRALAIVAGLGLFACSDSLAQGMGMPPSSVAGGGAGGAAPGAIAGAATAGIAGAVSSGGGGTSGSAGTTASSAGGGTAGVAGGSSAGAAGLDSYPALEGGGPCPANALLCDNFEQYTFVAMNPPLLNELVPNWAQYKFHGYPRVDPSKPFNGKQSATMDTEAGSYRFAGLIHDTPDTVAAVPLQHFGRLMVYLKALPKTSQWTIIELSGLLAGSNTELATYGVGGVGPHVGLSYTQRPRQTNPDGSAALRAGGPQSASENALAKANCMKNSDTVNFPVAKWVCVEWNLDASKSELHVWLDTTQGQVDALGSGASCVAPAAASTPWQGPERFTKVALDWEAYDSDSPQQQVWFDDFAIGTQRIGCPVPAVTP